VCIHVCGDLIFLIPSHKLRPHVHTNQCMRSEAFATVTYPGTGQYTMNGGRIGYWLTTEAVKVALGPVFLIGMQDKFDVHLKVRGGGTTGWYGAIRLAMARAMVEMLPAWKLKLRPGKSNCAAVDYLFLAS
jgi:ribosomal protein S9